MTEMHTEENRILSREGSIGIDERILVRKDSYNTSHTSEHFHDFLEIVYIVNGTATHIVNGQKYRAHIGDLYLLDFSDKHHFVDKDDDFMIITCAFTPDAVDDSLVESHNAHDVLQFLLFHPFADNENPFYFYINILKDGDDIIKLLEDMTDEYVRKKAGYQAVLKGYLLVLLSKVFRLAIEKGIKKTGAYQKEIVDTAIEYLKVNYLNPLSIDEVAKKVLLSPSYFSAVFKNYTGTSITDYIQRLRITRACYLLTTTSKTVDEVMGEVGYSDSKFFYKIFKRYTSLTPGMYKKKHTK